jgi:hypothetical protein
VKQTILVCDCCKDPRKPAVASLAINDGRGTKPDALDLCGDHLKLVRQSLTGMRNLRVERMSDEEIDTIHKKIVAWVVQNPGKRRRDIAYAMGGNPDRIGYHLKLLIANKTLKRTGIRTGTKYFPAK